jgi:hypothetical protein
MSPKSASNFSVEPISLQEYSELEEIARLRTNVLKKLETDCIAELERLAIQRDVHIREIRRIRDEDHVNTN